jgi:hypothetical protein
MYVRWPGHVTPGAVDGRLTGNIDIEPTILDAAGIAPAHTMDGASLLGPGARDRLLLEYFLSPDSPLRSWASDRTKTYQYVEWYDAAGTIVFREYYDLVNDPWQLTNLLGDGTTSNDPNVTQLHTRLTADRTCAGATCPQPSSTPDTEPPTVPGKPVGTSAVAGEIALSWAASTDDRATTIAYGVYRDGGESPIGSVDSSSSTTVGYTDRGLAPGTVHTYRVVASDGVNASAPSPTSDPITVRAGDDALFRDGFDAGLGSWTNVTNLTLDSAAFGAAAPSVRASVTGARAFARRALGATTDSMCLSAAVNVSSQGANPVALLKMLTAGNVSIGRVFVNQSRMLMVRADIPGTVFSTGRTLPAGWSTLRLCGATGTTGSWTLSLDGAQLGSWSANNGSTPIGRVQIGDDTAKTVTFNIDDVVAEGPPA